MQVSKKELYKAIEVGREAREKMMKSAEMTQKDIRTRVSIDQNFNLLINLAETLLDGEEIQVI